MTNPLANPRAIDLRPEAELLLCCARTRMDLDIAERMKELIREGLDWEYLVRAASRNGMTPLLYWHLKTIYPEGVPDTVIGGLRDYSHSLAARNLALAGELIKLLNLFQSHGISAIPYKGPALAASAYGNLALREFVDLDILVHKRDILRARDLLIAQRYQAERQLTSSQKAVLVQIDCELCAYQEERSILVELHWAFTAGHYSLPLDPEPMWERLEPFRLLGATLPTLSPEDLLLILCVHGAGHRWIELKWICDVAELIRANPQMDWERILKQADAVARRRMLRLGLFLASDLLGAGLSETMSLGIEADPSIRALAKEVCAGLFRDRDSLPPLVESILFYIRANDRLTNGLLFCLRVATTPNIRDLAVLSLPTSLFPLYYILRPLRLIGQAISRPFQSFLNHSRKALSN